MRIQSEKVTTSKHRDQIDINDFAYQIQQPRGIQFNQEDDFEEINGSMISKKGSSATKKKYVNPFELQDQPSLSINA